MLLANAKVRMASKDLPAAQQALTRASRLAEFDAQQQLQIAVQQMAAQDVKGAQYSLTKALQGQPDYLPAKAMLVDVSVRLGELTQAEQQARDIVARQPKLAVGYSLLGDVAASRGQTAVALDAYRKANDIEPTPATLMRPVRAMLQQDAAGASQLAEKWLKTHPKDLQVRRALADGYARSGNYAAARSAYEVLLASTPDDPEALNNLANILLMKRDPKALQVAEKALARKPGAPYIIGTVGWAAFQAGQGDRALQLLRDARLRDPGNADTRYFLGCRARQQRPVERSARRIAGGIAHRPDVHLRQRSR